MTSWQPFWCPKTYSETTAILVTKSFFRELNYTFIQTSSSCFPVIKYGLMSSGTLLAFLVQRLRSQSDASEMHKAFLQNNINKMAGLLYTTILTI